MPRVQNHSGKGVPLLRWRVLPDGRVIDPLGEIQDRLPDDIGYSDQAKRLCRLNVLKVEGINWFPKEPEKPKPKLDPSMPEMEKPAPDDLTELVHIGKGRACKLEEFGVRSFVEVVALGVDELGALLEVAKDMAEEVVEDAAGRVG